MTKLLNLATGDFLIFMGADDVFYNDEVISNMVLEMKESDSVYYGSVIFKGLGTKHWGKFNKIKWATTNVCHQAIFYPKSVYSKYSYNTDYKLFADYVYNLNLLKNQISFEYVDIITVLYDINGASSSNKDANFYRDYGTLVIESVCLGAYLLGILIRNGHFLKKKILKK